MDGTPIPEVEDPTAWVNLTTGAWCYYNNDPAMGAIYGKLYNWYAVNDPRGLASVGWHIPSDSEWKALEMCLGMSQSDADNIGERGTDEGGKLKEAGTLYWQTPNLGATNSSGFFCLPGGYRDNGGTFYDIGGYGLWWSSTEYDATSAWSRYLPFFNAYSYRYDDYEGDGFSVRCVGD